MQELEGKVAVITGAGSGIGEGIAQAAARAGMKVVIADVDTAAAEAVAAMLVASGAEALAVECDVSDLESVEALKRATLDAYGAVHLLCNNAGVCLSALMHEADIRDWQFMINVNLYGVIHGVKVFAPLFVEQGEGHIVNTASMGGLISGPPTGLYSVTKFGVVGLSESLLMELAEHGVGVSVLCPGLTDTNLMSQSLAVRPDALNSGIDHQQEDPDTAAGISPAVVGEQVIDAVRESGFYIITHDDYREIVKMRHDGILEALDAHTARYGSTRQRQD